MAAAIKVENLSKAYQLGEIGTGTLSRDIERWVAKLRGKEDPFLKIGETNDRTTKGTSDVVWSLKDINFKIEQGDAVGIIGRNGAGKSTLLKLLSRVTSPTTGNIKVKGRIASLLEVGTGFHPELTGRENIYLNGAILGMRKKEITRKFDEIVEFSGVERYIDTPVKRYSSGMYVRLAFAVAAHLDSEILIVDEVLAVGDAEFQNKCLGKMGEVSKGEGRTVLFVSHNMPSIQALCSSAIVLNYGRLKFQDEVNNAVSFYLNDKRSRTALNISERKDRSGNGLIRITNIQLRNIEQEIISKGISGSYLKITLQYYSKESIRNQLWFRLQFVDSHDNTIFICNNEHSYKLLSSEEDSLKEVDCIIPNLPLFAGDYYINVTCQANNIGVLDDVEVACKLEVEDGDFFGTGKLPGIKKGILVKHFWEE